MKISDYLNQMAARPQDVRGECPVCGRNLVLNPKGELPWHPNKLGCECFGVGLKVAGGKNQ